MTTTDPTASEAVRTVLATVQDGWRFPDLAERIIEMFPHLKLHGVAAAIWEHAKQGPDGLWRAERRDQ